MQSILSGLLINGEVVSPSTENKWEKTVSYLELPGG